MGAIEERNEFNSSFYTVIELPPLSPWDCEGLLWKRWVVSHLQAAARFELAEAPGHTVLAGDRSLVEELGTVTQRLDPLLRGTDFDADVLLERRFGAYQRLAAPRFSSEPPSDYEAEVGLVLGVLTAGNPREVVRMADLVAHTERPPDVSPGVHAAKRVLATEILEFRRAVLSADGVDETVSPADGNQVSLLRSLEPKALPDDLLRLAAFEVVREAPGQGTALLSPDAKVGVATILGELGASALEGAGGQPFDADFRTLWSPDWADPEWDARFQERWGRLLIRLQVGRIIATAEPEQIPRYWRFLEVLRDVVAAGSESSEVARRLIGRLELDRPEPFSTTAVRLRSVWAVW